MKIALLALLGLMLGALGGAALGMARGSPGWKPSKPLILKAIAAC